MHRPRIAANPGRRYEDCFYYYDKQEGAAGRTSAAKVLEDGTILSSFVNLFIQNADVGSPELGIHPRIDTQARFAAAPNNVKDAIILEKVLGLLFDSVVYDRTRDNFKVDIAPISVKNKYFYTDPTTAIGMNHPGGPFSACVVLRLRSPIVISYPADTYYGPATVPDMSTNNRLTRYLSNVRYDINASANQHDNQNNYIKYNRIRHRLASPPHVDDDKFIRCDRINGGVRPGAQYDNCNVENYNKNAKLSGTSGFAGIDSYVKLRNITLGNAQGNKGFILNDQAYSFVRALRSPLLDQASKLGMDAITGSSHIASFQPDWSPQDNEIKFSCPEIAMHPCGRDIRKCYRRTVNVNWHGPIQVQEPVVGSRKTFRLSIDQAMRIAGGDYPPWLDEFCKYSLVGIFIGNQAVLQQRNIFNNPANNLNIAINLPLDPNDLYTILHQNAAQFFYTLSILPGVRFSFNMIKKVFELNSSTRNIPLIVDYNNGHTPLTRQVFLVTSTANSYATSKRYFFKLSVISIIQNILGFYLKELRYNKCLYEINPDSINLFRNLMLNNIGAIQPPITRLNGMPSPIEYYANPNAYENNPDIDVLNDIIQNIEHLPWMLPTLHIPFELINMDDLPLRDNHGNHLVPPPNERIFSLVMYMTKLWYLISEMYSGRLGNHVTPDTSLHCIFLRRLIMASMCMGAQNPIQWWFRPVHNDIIKPISNNGQVNLDLRNDTSDSRYEHRYDFTADGNNIYLGNKKMKRRSLSKRVKRMSGKNKNRMSGTKRTSRTSRTKDRSSKEKYTLYDGTVTASLDREQEPERDIEYVKEETITDDNAKTIADLFSKIDFSKTIYEIKNSRALSKQW